MTPLSTANPTVLSADRAIPVAVDKAFARCCGCLDWTKVMASIIKSVRKCDRIRCHLPSGGTDPSEPTKRPFERPYRSARDALRAFHRPTNETGLLT
jgi:hypothetical protein